MYKYKSRQTFLPTYNCSVAEAQLCDTTFDYSVNLHLYDALSMWRFAAEIATKFQSANIHEGKYLSLTSLYLKTASSSSDMNQFTDLSEVSLIL
jgi:hypothetical protein